MKKININIKNIWLMVIIFILILPDDFFKLFSIYNSGTPASISYKWLDYQFGILQMCILLTTLFLMICLKTKPVMYIFGYAIIRELMLFFLQENSMFKNNSFEMYLTILVGFSFIVWMLYNCKDCQNNGHCITTEEKAVKWYEIFLLSNIFTVYIMAAMGGGKGILAGRCNASNLDVGSTGCLCCIGVIFTLFKKNYKPKCIVLAVIFLALWLSGSRTNFLLGCIILVCGIVVLLWDYINNHGFRINTYYYITFIIGLFLVLLVLVFKWDSIVNEITTSRYAALLNFNDMRTDDSVNGRMKSIKAGLSLLKSHPFGISGYFINLQTEIRARGFETFPHCGILSNYLLFGPIILVLYYYWIKLAIKLFKIDKRYSFVLAFFAVYNIIAGGPIVNFKVIYMYGMPTTLAYMKYKDTYGKQVVKLKD